MDFSAANTGLWNIIIQLGIIAAVILVSTFLRRKIPFIRDSLLPTAVLGGFLLFILRHVGLLKLDLQLMEILVYHCIALGFIAMSLRVSSGASKSGGLVGAKSGATIVSTYLIQGAAGLIITIALAYLFMPGLFKAAGLLLPMGYGQGPGQANNIGTTYEGLGFTGGRSFGLAIAAAGYLCACIVGVIMLNVYAKKGKVSRARRDEVSGSVTVDHFQDVNEIPIAESVDRFSIQIAMVLLVYLVTYLVTWGITAGIGALAPGLGKTVNSLLWGFNFIIVSALAILAKVLLKGAKKLRWMNRQYQNNYLLSRLSGFFFDFMMVAGPA
jgi:ESS family glutamate:Na+ symporter